MPNLHMCVISYLQLFAIPVPPGSSVHGIFQARILAWVAISFSGDLPNPGIKPGSSALQVDSLPGGRATRD